MEFFNGFCLIFCPPPSPPVFFTDEAGFTPDGIMNFHHQSFVADVSLKEIIPSRRQKKKYIFTKCIIYHNDSYTDRLLYFVAHELFFFFHWHYSPLCVLACRTISFHFSLSPTLSIFSLSALEYLFIQTDTKTGDF